MPKYRQLHTKILDSFDFNEMPDDFTRVTWMLLTLILDSEGRGIDNMAWIKSKIYPLRDNVPLEQIAAAFEWYASEDRKMIIRYEVNGRFYFYVPTFKDYQKGTEYEAKSILPPPPVLPPGNLQVTSEQNSGNLQVTSEQNSGNLQVTSEQNSGSLEEAPEQVSAAESASASESAFESESASESAFAPRPGIFKTYETEIGPLTPMIADALKVAEKDYPPEWLFMAFQEAANHNKRSWKYCEAILKRWKAEGFGSNGKARAPVTGKISAAEILAQRRERMEKNGEFRTNPGDS